MNMTKIYQENSSLLHATAKIAPRLNTSLKTLKITLFSNLTFEQEQKFLNA